MITVVTAPAGEPLTVDETKLFIRDDAIADQDDVVEMLISAARQFAEQELGRYLITQTLDFSIDRFPCNENQKNDSRRYDGLAPYAILLPPLQSVTSITYVDLAGATQTLAVDQYQVDAKSRPARILPAYGVFWPSTREQPNAITVRFVAGYGTAEQVPQCVKQWMLLKIKAGYDNRDTFALDARAAIAQLPKTYIDSLLDPERVPGWR
jgi:uncharacterized phiE125 gp8 family phage protein